MRLIVSTRPEPGGGKLLADLRDQGLPCVGLPGMAIVPARSPVQAADRLQQAERDDLWIFTSGNAIRHGFQLLRAHARLPRRWPVLAVLGEGSKQQLQAELEATGKAEATIIQPARELGFDSEALLQHPRLTECRARRILLLGAPGGRRLLPEELRRRGADVQELAVYERIPADLPPAALQCLAGWDGDPLTLWTSNTAIENLHRQLPRKLWQRLMRGAHLVLSERQRRALLQHDAVTITLAQAPDRNSLVRQLAGMCRT